jgi:hypothetical protein
MSLTLQSWVDQAVQQARRQLPDASITRLEVLGNALLQEAMQKLARSTAADPETRPLLRKSKTVAFTNGAGTLSDDVLTEYARDSSLTDTASITKRYALEPLRSSFERVYDRRIGYYHIDGSAVLIVEPGVGYVEGAGLTGSRRLLIPCVPDVPTLASDPVVIVEELASDAVAVLADLIVGKASEEAAEAA